MANFQWERLLMALGSVSGMQAAYEKTVAYCQERQAFGGPLTSKQVVRHKLADIATRIHAGRCVTYDALERFYAGEDVVQQATTAKLVTQRTSFEGLDQCLQPHGGAKEIRELKAKGA